MISPKSNIAKRYVATLDRPLEGHEAEAFAAGTLMLESETDPLAPAVLEPTGPNGALLTITEGRYHQVRRMFAAVGNHVTGLHRDRIGGLALPAEMEPGAWRISFPRKSRPRSSAERPTPIRRPGTCDSSAPYCGAQARVNHTGKVNHLLKPAAPGLLLLFKARAHRLIPGRQLSRSGAMFEFGRELMKLIAGERAKPFADGLTGGDATLLELLDLNLLTQEAKGADVAAGRIGAKDKAQLRLDAAVVWREVARRSGDAVALRKAAATAEAAAAAFDPDRRPDGWARARCEQGVCALLGAELFGDPGLNAAAEAAFREARAAARGGLSAALADVGVAIVEGRQDLAMGDQEAARRAAARFNSPIAALDTLGRRVAAARPLAAEARLARADLLCGWGARLKDETLLKLALDDAKAAGARLDAGYEPLSWARAEILHGQALALWGEAAGDVDAVATGATALASALDHMTRDHSPLDWARTQIALAQALQALGEASADERAYEQAVTCYDRANLVLRTPRHSASGSRGRRACHVPRPFRRAHWRSRRAATPPRRP